jgi:hypothetical protein
MTTDEMLARIAALDAQLSHKPRRAKGEAQAAKRAAIARRRQFRLDRWRRENSHRALNRYGIQH